MARPLRLEFTGALYHVTARGNERHDIFPGNPDDDRVAFLETLSSTCDRFNWICHVYCLITNHYHLLVETPDANLSKGMRHGSNAVGSRSRYLILQNMTPGTAKRW